MEPSVISFKDFDYKKMGFPVYVRPVYVRYGSHKDIPKQNLTYGSKYEDDALLILQKECVDDNDKKQESERTELFKYWENK